MVTTSKPPTRPSEKVQSKPLMKATISELVAINFSVPAATLEPRVPKGLELDFLGDETFVSLICCVVQKAGVLPNPFSRGFVHLSLQYYVRRIADPLSRVGVCPIRNYVSSTASGWGAKLEADCRKLKMKRANSGFNGKSFIPEVEYQWKAGENWNKLRIKARSKMKNLGPKNRVGFVMSHRNIYQSVKGKTMEFLVQRKTWDAWDAAQANFTCDVQHLFGKEFVKPLGRRPASVFVSSGSEVEYSKPTQIA